LSEPIKSNEQEPEIIMTNEQTAIVPSAQTGLTFPSEKVELLKRTICKGATDDELELFIHACQRTGLDPFMKQVYAVKRWQDGKDVMVIQTGIDGYRLIAERSEKYMPGREPTFAYDKDGYVISATAYVKKMDKNGQWHEIGATARFDEYVGTKRDGSPNQMWATKPHIMLAKCAEALVLRKAFPAEMSGVYTREEMEQADNVVPLAQSAGRPVKGRVNTETGEVHEDEGGNGDRVADPLEDDATFITAWHGKLKKRPGEWTAEEADKALAGILTKAKKSLPEINLKGRHELLAKAAAGKFDASRDAARQAAKGGETTETKPAPEASTPPANQDAVPTSKSAEVATWESTRAAMRAAAGDAVTDEVFERAMSIALTAAGKKDAPETTTRPWRANLLDAIRAKMFAWHSGTVMERKSA